MEKVTDEQLSKLSRTEQRKLKLAEYLASKGRLKVPNPKPYLKDKPVTTKNAETYPKAKTASLFLKAGDDKENCDINGANVKEVKRAKSLAEIRKKAANFSLKTKLGTDTLSREKQHSSTISHNPSLKTTVCPANLQVVRGHSNRPASTQNPRELHKTEKPASSQPQQNPQNVQTKVRQPSAHASNNTQKSRKSNLGPPQPKTDLHSKRPLDKKLPSVNTVAVPNKTTSAAEKKLKSRRPANNTSDKTKVQTSNVCKAQTRLTNLTQQSRAQSVVPKLGTHNSNVISWTSQSNPNKNEKKDLSSVTTKVDPTTKKSQNAMINKTTGVSSAISKPSNSDATTVNKNKQHIAVKPAIVTASKQLFGRNTKSSVLPQTATISQESQMSNKRFSQTKPTVQLQTPRTSFCPSTQGVRTVPVEGKKMMTVAQEERLHKLQEWRESRGITYKRPPMPVRVVRRKTVSALPQPYWTAMEQEDNAHDIVFAVDRSLDDCIKLLQQGFPVEQVRDVLSRVPMAQKFAKYWICQARLMEREGNLEVLPMFQEAVRVVREPVDELRSVVFEILKKNQAQGSTPFSKQSEVAEAGADDEQEVPDDVMCTPKPVGALICGMRRDSSVVKFKITATPGGKRSGQVPEPGQVDGHKIHFFTPVRRSVRIERTARRYPTALLEHDPCVTSLSDLASESKGEVKGDSQSQYSPVYVYRENEALRNHVQVQLVYPDEIEA